jgi:L-rhamnose-H+ transport protein
MVGIGIGAFGILLSGLAGWLKEKDLGEAAGSFSPSKGLPLCILAGVLSAVYGFSLAAGQPVADVAAKYGAGQFEGNVIYLFSNTGAFLTTAIYCTWLHVRHRTLGEYFELPAGAHRARLPLNFALAALTGLLWYGQFFFYGLGHVRMGDYKFSSWGIHMIMLVLISALVGLAFREWRGCSRRTWTTLAAALLVLVLAVLTLAYGNYLAESTPAHG